MPVENSHARFGVTLSIKDIDVQLPADEMDESKFGHPFFKMKSKWHFQRSGGLGERKKLMEQEIIRFYVPFLSGLYSVSEACGDRRVALVPG